MAARAARCSAVDATIVRRGEFGDAVSRLASMGDATRVGRVLRDEWRRVDEGEGLLGSVRVPRVSVGVYEQSQAVSSSSELEDAG